MAHLLRRLATGEEGATMVEYAIMLSLIGAALVTTITALSSTVGDKFTSVGTTISGAS
jgi:Flp pilus assembly pilin Flp